MPCGPWILDFLFVAERLVIEVDGETHATTDGLARDSRRDAWLAACGYRVLRFSNRDVLGNLAGVLTAIAAALARPHPGPLPEGEGAALPPLPPGEGRGEGRPRRTNGNRT